MGGCNFRYSREGLTEKAPIGKTLNEGREGTEHPGEEYSGQRNSQCKGPALRRSKEASVVQWMWGRVRREAGKMMGESSPGALWAAIENIGFFFLSRMR